VAVNVPPLQLPTTLKELATTMPEGKLSLNATDVSPNDVFGLVTVKVSVEVPPT